MCGFVGGVKKDGLNEDDLHRLNSSLKVIENRGPDASSSWHDDRLFIGHNRLSIIDVTDNSKQPYFSDCGRYAIIFNGEIYNYKELVKKHLQNTYSHIDFRGDTIALLYMFKKYGKDCLSYLNGMFAFAIVDLHNKTIFLARDRFGEKPLYYFINNNYIYFGSEIKIFPHILNTTLTVDIKSINYFTHFGSIPSPYTIYENIKKLEPASFIEVNYKENISISAEGKYWTLLDKLRQKSREEYSRDEANHLIREQLVKTIESRLISDVEVGLFLSGGLDSASVLSTLKHLNKNIKCITCDFENPIYSELDKTKTTAAYFDYPLTSHIITEDSINTSIPSFISSMDQPTVDGLNNYFVASFAKSHNIKVWLNGTGGDEIFGGYSSFYNIGKRIKMAKANPFLKFNAHSINKIISNPKYNRFLYLLFHDHNYNSRAYITFRSALPPNATILNEGFINNQYVDTIFQKDPFEGVEIDDFQKASYYECSYYLANQLLRDADIFSMHYSLELRAPFLDHELYDLVFPMSEKLKVDRTGQLKPLLVNNLYNPLPKKVATQKKSGFGLPHKEYLRKHSDEVLQVLTDRSINIWDQKMLLKSFKSFKEGNLNPDLIWMVYILNKWLMQKDVNL